MDITLKTEYNVVKIYFNGIIHLRFNRPSLVGFQSWSCDSGKWAICYTFESNTITCEYDSAEKWKAVLKLLDEKL